MRIVATDFGIAMGLLTIGDALAAKNSNRIEGKGTAAQAWALIGDFCGVTAWHPAIAKCETSVRDGARIRTLTTKEGAVFVEKLAKWDDEGTSYTYEILESPLPVKNYVSTLKVEEDDEPGKVAITWSSDLRTQGRVGGRGPQGRRGCLSGGIAVAEVQAEGQMTHAAPTAADRPSGSGRRQYASEVPQPRVSALSVTASATASVGARRWPTFRSTFPPDPSSSCWGRTAPARRPCSRS